MKNYLFPLIHFLYHWLCKTCYCCLHSSQFHEMWALKLNIDQSVIPKQILQDEKYARFQVKLVLWQTIFLSHCWLAHTNNNTPKENNSIRNNKVLFFFSFSFYLNKQKISKFSLHFLRLWLGEFWIITGTTHGDFTSGLWIATRWSYDMSDWRMCLFVILLLSISFVLLLWK